MTFFDGAGVRTRSGTVQHLVYLGPIQNHGSTLGQFGSGLVLGIARHSSIQVDIVCPARNSDSAEPDLPWPSNVRIVHTFKTNRTPTILGLVRVIGQSEGKVAVFNLTPTSAGPRNLGNAAMLAVPILTAMLHGKRVYVVYHNSSFTTDYGALGYSSFFDSIRARTLRVIETILFKTTSVTLLLRQYQQKVKLRSGRHVDYNPFQYVEALPGLAAMGLATDGKVDRLRIAGSPAPTILMHGNWGPQKDLSRALSTLRILKQDYDFRLVISGSINSNFRIYSRQFEAIISRYSDLHPRIVLGVPEIEMPSLFLESDLVLMPYLASGGRSGVMELATFYSRPVIATTTEEFVEQSSLKRGVTLCSLDSLSNEIESFLKQWRGRLDGELDVTGCVATANREIDSFLAKVSLGFEDTSDFS